MSWLHRVYKQWQTACHEFGMVYAASMFMRRYIFNNLLHLRLYQIFHKGNLGTGISEKTTPDIQQVTVTDLPLLAACGYPPTMLKRWLEEGATGWFITKDGELVACVWQEVNAQYQLYEWLVLESATPVLWYLWWWVAPIHRKQGYADRVRIPGVLAGNAIGIDDGLTVVDAFNRNALHGVKRLGWNRINFLLVLRIAEFTILCTDQSIRFRYRQQTDPMVLKVGRKR